MMRAEHGSADDRKLWGLDFTRRRHSPAGKQRPEDLGVIQPLQEGCFFSWTNESMRSTRATKILLPAAPPD